MSALEKDSEQKKNEAKQAGDIFLQELSRKPSNDSSFFSKLWSEIQLPFLAIFSGLFLGALIIVFTSPDVY